MFEEVRLAAFLAKGSSGDPTALPAPTALAMATRIGARALHIGDITGSLEPGKRADLILVDTSPLHNSPRFERDPNNAYAQLVYAAKSTDVSDVMVTEMADARQEAADAERSRPAPAGRRLCRRIDIFLLAREQSVLSKLIALGGSTRARVSKYRSRSGSPVRMRCWPG